MRTCFDCGCRCALVKPSFLSNDYVYISFGVFIYIFGMRLGIVQVFCCCCWYFLLHFFWPLFLILVKLIFLWLCVRVSGIRIIFWHFSAVLLFIGRWEREREREKEKGEWEKQFFFIIHKSRLFNSPRPHFSELNCTLNKYAAKKTKPIWLHIKQINIKSFMAQVGQVIVYFPSHHHHHHLHDIENYLRFTMFSIKLKWKALNHSISNQNWTTIIFFFHFITIWKRIHERLWLTLILLPNG